MKMLSLLKISFLENFQILKLKNKTKGSISLFVLFLLGIFILIFGWQVSLFFSVISKFKQNPNARIDIVCYTSAFQAFLFSFLITAGVAEKMIIKPADYAFLSSLPVKKESIILSKFLLLYFSTLFAFSIIFIPTCLAINFLIGLSVVGVLNILLICICGGLYAAAIGTFLSFLVSVIFKKTRKGNIGMAVFFSFFGIILTIVMTFFSSASVNTITKFEKVILYSFYPVVFVKEIILNKSLIGYIGLVGIGVFLLLINVFLLGLNFTKLNTQKNIKTKNAKKELTFVKTNVKKAIFKKDLKSILQNANFLTMIIMSTLLPSVIIISNYFLIKVKEDFAFLMTANSLIFICGAISTGPYSMALEGNGFWLIKSAPVRGKDFISGKVLAAFVVQIPMMVITILSTFVVIYLIKIHIFFYIVYFFAFLFAILTNSYLGVLLSVRFPKFTTNFSQIKRSKAVFVFNMIYFGLLLVFIIGFTFLFKLTGLIISGAFILGFWVLFFIIVVSLFHTVGIKQFEKIKIL